MPGAAHGPKPSPEPITFRSFTHTVTSGEAARSGLGRSRWPGRGSRETGLASGSGGWDGAARAGSAGMALVVGRAVVADRHGPDRVGHLDLGDLGLAWRLAPSL
jgi:hypothetical protein